MFIIIKYYEGIFQTLKIGPRNSRIFQIFVLFHVFLEPASIIKIASCGFQELSVSYFNNSVIS